MTKNVITAGPSAGKTSTIRELSARGHYVVPEAARLYIDQQISEGRDEADIHTDSDFQDDIIETDRRLENNIPQYPEEAFNQAVFMDRSLTDNIAYLRYFGDAEIPQTGAAKKTDDMKQVEKLLEETENKYDNVFLLEQLPFEDDYARREDAQQAKELHQELEKAYRDAGYNPVEIDVKPVDQRANEILDEIRKEVQE